MIDDNDAYVTRVRSDTRPQVLAQVEDGKQLAANVRDALDPGLGAGHAGESGGYREHLAGLFARGEVQLASHAERHAHPLARARIFLCRGGSDRTATTLELGKQLE